MFVLTTLAYPVVLALLCVGAGLLVDRLSGGWLDAVLLPAVGAAALIVVSQLSTYVTPLAPATPYLLLAVAIAGFAIGRTRARALVLAARGAGDARWRLLVFPLAYLLALAPVLLAGRATFSSYMALADSAVHMLGADFLMRHGQDYSHLDLHNSYGLYMRNYYGSSYPSGADTLYGGSSFLLGLPLIWTFQPFVAFMLATAAGPAWVLVKRVGLHGAWAALATLTVTLPALVYAYELIGSVKEIASLPLILGMGALVVSHRRWLSVGARGAIPFALLVAAGISALGVAFGAWALAAALVLGVVAIAQLTLRRVGGLLAVGGLVLVAGAWPTWANVSGSLSVAGAIASTSNPGNVHTPLRAWQMLGVWLGGSYLESPTGVLLALTVLAIAFVLLAAIVGVGNAVRSRWYALAGWFGLSILLWLLLSTFATTWANAKTLMLTSPLVVVMAWAGISALRSSRVAVLAPLVGALLVGGVVVSDALQYHASNLAPTARYEELASINTRFAGQGPTLFEDFDEYALYELRDMDVGGPSFVYAPPALAAVAGHGKPVNLGLVAPSALLGYPLIVIRRDPSATRPPAAYRLLWEGVYYQVWGRRAHAPAALAHVTISAPITRPRAQCAALGRVAAVARGDEVSRLGSSSASMSQGGGGSEAKRVHLVVAIAPELVRVRFKLTHRPHRWGRTRAGIVMHGSGTLSASFTLPHAGRWELWVKGEVMRPIDVAIDGRKLGALGGQLDGNSLVANPLTPISATLAAGRHTLTLTRPGANLAPGDGGAATLAAIFLVPAGPAGAPRLRAAPVASWRELCGSPLQWVEIVPTRPRV